MWVRFLSIGSSVPMFRSQTGSIGLVTFNKFIQTGSKVASNSLERNFTENRQSRQLVRTFKIPKNGVKKQQWNF
jgi:hypothetical protein